MSIREPSGELSRARASETTQGVEARIVGIITPGVARVMATTHRTHRPRLGTTRPLVFEERKLSRYLMNSLIDCRVVISRLPRS
jgi:hypothetical protein